MRIGDETSGFSLDLEPGTSVLRVRAWGFWDAVTAQSFGDAVVEACAKTGAVNRLILDMTGLKPMRAEGQASFQRLVEAVVRTRTARVTLITSSALTRLQLLRLATERGAKDLIEFATAPEQPEKDMRSSR